MPGARIVSLVPSLTETLFELALHDSVIGVTSYCTFPESAVERLPHVGGTKTPRIEEIRALKPDLVHMNLEENLEAHAEKIREFAQVFVTEPASVDDVDDLFVTLGELHDRRGEALRLRTELSRVRTEIGVRPANFRFAVPIWKHPWMWAGGDTYVSNLIAACGGTNVLADRRRYPDLPIADVLDLSPDFIFLPDEPWRFTGSDAAELDASGVGVIGPFPGHYVTWHGVRTIHGLRFVSGLVG